MTVGADCSASCAEMPECVVCHRTKAPVGRDPGVVAANGYCAHECPGHREAPHPGHLWPSEWADHENGDHRACNSCGGETLRCLVCKEPAYDCECTGGPQCDPEYREQREM